MTVHPGIGYDIIANHPIFNGAVIGRAATHDFRLIGGSVETLDGGVVLSIGSAIMGPQVFEKSLSCVNNLRLQDGRPIVAGHSIHVIDLQDGETIKENHQRGWYTQKEENDLERSMQELKDIGERILILDEQCCPNVDAEIIL